MNSGLCLGPLSANCGLECSALQLDADVVRGALLADAVELAPASAQCDGQWSPWLGAIANRQLINR
jgi:hypothetical protein